MYVPGDALSQTFDVISTTGALSNADSTPTGTVTRNGTDDGTVTVTITTPGTGRYKAVFTIPLTYSAGDSVGLSIAATVGGVATGATFGPWPLDSKRWATVLGSQIPSANAGQPAGLGTLNGSSNMPAAVNQWQLSTQDGFPAVDVAAWDGQATSVDSNNLPIVGTVHNAVVVATNQDKTGYAAVATNLPADYLSTAELTALNAAAASAATAATQSTAAASSAATAATESTAAASSAATAATQSTAAASSAATAATQSTAAASSAATAATQSTAAASSAAIAVEQTTTAAIEAATNVTVTPIQANCSNPRWATRNLPPIAQGSAPAEMWTVLDGSGNPINLATALVRMVVYKETCTDGQPTETPLYKYETGGAGITIGGTDNNVVTVQESSANTATPGKYFYWLWNVTGNQAGPIPIAWGTLTIRPALIDV